VTPDLPQQLDITDARLRNSTFRDVDLSATGFHATRLAGSTFRDVDLSDTVFEDVSVRGARFTEADLTGVTITDSNVAGMRIDGVLVSDLVASYRARQR